MNNMSRTGFVRSLFAATLLASAIATPEREVLAMSVYCTNCSTVWDQLTQYANELQITQNTLQAYQLQLQQYANEVQNMQRLPASVYSNAMTDMSAVFGIMKAGSQLSAANITPIGTFSSFLSQNNGAPMSVADQANEYDIWSNRSRDSVSAAIAAVAAQTAQMTTDDQAMQGLQAQTASVQGVVQAIQNVAQIAAQGVREQEKLRQLVMVVIQLLANQMANEAEAKAIAGVNQINASAFPTIDPHLDDLP